MDDNEELRLTQPAATWSPMINSLINQYLALLGDFHFEDNDINTFREHPSETLCWIFFVLSTFFTNVVLLNLFIAVMSNTFNMVIEKQDQLFL